MLQISEIFGPTIQGEGKKIGTPSIFIRLTRCNMQCCGFNVAYEVNEEQKKGCDTYYAVDKAFASSWKTYTDVKEIVHEVNTLAKNKKYDIVFTGGEPLIYWNNATFQSLLEYFVSNGFSVTIETNASIEIEFSQSYQYELLFSMGVKLSNTQEPYAKRVNFKALSTIINSAPSYFKFVISKNDIQQSMDEIHEILKQVPKTEVFLMPMAENKQALNANAHAVIEAAIEHEFYYSDRLHVRIWNKKRGV
jgi:organic radical activating enzyme